MRIWSLKASGPCSRKENNNNKRTNVKITFNDKTQSIEQWASDLGISYNALYNRIRVYGWSIERAMTKAQKPRSSKSSDTILITFNGRTQNISSWANEMNIKKSILYKRIVVHGWTTERALTTPAKPHTTAQLHDDQAKTLGD